MEELLSDEHLNNTKIRNSNTSSTVTHENTGCCSTKPLTDLSVPVTSQTNLASGIPERVPLDACADSVEKFRLTEQVWPLPLVPAPGEGAATAAIVYDPKQNLRSSVKAVAPTVGCLAHQPLVQCHEAKGTLPNCPTRRAKLSNDNSLGPFISCNVTDESSDRSSEGSSLTSNSSTDCDAHLLQEQASHVAQQEANGQHRLYSPQFRVESRPRFVHPQPTSPPPAVLMPHSAPVTPRSSLRVVSLAPLALKFPTPPCKMKQELSSA